MPFQTKNDQIVKMRTQADQLRRHLKMERVPTSKTIRELVDFCARGLGDDPLVYPVKENPFKEQKRCAIL